MIEDSAERELYERIRAGDKTACSECIERHAPGVYRVALRILGDPAEAEDVMQETFSSAFTKIDSFEWRSGMTTWLYRIASNAALMRLRGRKPVAFSIDEDDSPAEIDAPAQLFDWCCLPEQDFETAEAQGQIEAAIAHLPENLRLVFVMRELEGLSTEQTAETLGLSVENVKVRLHRARLALREALSGYFTELAAAKRQVDHET
jgi:RNA polymerase sigma-70 factor, ECF subfamily